MIARHNSDQCGMAYKSRIAITSSPSAPPPSAKMTELQVQALISLDKDFGADAEGAQA
jgi:hypothetical protein